MAVWTPREWFRHSVQVPGTASAPPKTCSWGIWNRICGELKLMYLPTSRHLKPTPRLSQLLAMSCEALQSTREVSRVGAFKGLDPEEWEVPKWPSWLAIPILSDWPKRRCPCTLRQCKDSTGLCWVHTEHRHPPGLKTGKLKAGLSVSEVR